MAAHGRPIPRQYSDNCSGRFFPPVDDSDEGRARYEDMWKLGDAGFIHQESPDPYTPAVANAFYDLALANTDPARRAKILPVLPHPVKPFRIWRNKFDPTLIELMEELNLAHPVNNEEIEADPICGAIYMRLLAQHMTGQRPLVTDDPVFEAMAYMPAADTEMRGDKGFLLASAVFRTSVPIDIENVPIRDFIQFRNDHRDARLAFYTEIQKMAADVGKLRSPEQITQAVDHYADTVDGAVRQLEQKLKQLNLTCVPACFGVSLPSWLTAPWGLGLTARVALPGVNAQRCCEFGQKLQRTLTGKSRWRGRS